MKRIFFKSAFTLIELIVASLLVSIVVLGVISIHTVLSGNNQDYSQRYSIKSQTQVTLNHILNNAALATGSANCNDEAILIGGQTVSAACGGGSNGLFDVNTFCIHQPGDSPSVNNGNNLINNPGDIWLCYQWFPGPSNQYQIQWCAEAYNGTVGDPRGASSCSTSATLLPAGATPTYLGNAFTLPLVSYTHTQAQLQFAVTLTSCLNNAAAAPQSCSTTGTSGDPVNNPEVQLSGSVIPLQAST